MESFPENLRAKYGSINIATGVLGFLTFCLMLDFAITVPFVASPQTSFFARFQVTLYISLLFVALVYTITDFIGFIYMALGVYGRSTSREEHDRLQSVMQFQDIYFISRVGLASFIFYSQPDVSIPFFVVPLVIFILSHAVVVAHDHFIVLPLEKEE
jgi:hypothetical protein